MLTAKPPKTDWELLCWYWYFRADQAGDIVPALSATELQRLDKNFLGQELDLIAKYAIGPRSNGACSWSMTTRRSAIGS